MTYPAITAYDRFVFHDVTYQAGSFYFLCLDPSGLDTILVSKDLVTFGRVTRDIITPAGGAEVTRLAIGNGKLIAIDPGTVNYLLG